MLTWTVLFVLDLFVLTGCAAAYTPPPLTTQHPAHPEATAAPTLLPSTTLAYGPSDLSAPQPASVLAQHGGHGAYLSAQGGQPVAVGEGAPLNWRPSADAVAGEGKVIAVVPGSSQIVVDHQEIPGVMGAMTMGYRVEPPSLLAKVQAGDMIRFTMDTQQMVIVKIEKLNK